jgi:DNA-directed RNA polymerase specialized sigma24 family protein
MAERKKRALLDVYTDPKVATDPEIRALLLKTRPIHERYTILLSERHIETLDCLLLGMSYTKIAHETRVGIDAVRSAIRDIAEYLDCDVSEIKKRCRERGWYAPD